MKRYDEGNMRRLENETAGRRRWAIRCRTIAIALLTFMTPVFADETSRLGADCVLEPGPPHAVVRVIDAETIRLDDTSEVRLIGALAPRAPEADAEWPPERDAKAALAGMVMGQTVRLAFSGRRTDRYGRLLAHVFIDRDSKNGWVQGELLKSGHARAYGLPSNVACLDELIAAEGQARLSGQGLWSNAGYAIRASAETAQLNLLRDTFQLIEGRIVQVSRTKNHVYLNFGADWRNDFTAGVTLDRTSRDWAEALAQLEGRRVRVRGWIERHNGPYVAITDRSQVEVLADELPLEPQPRRKRSRKPPPGTQTTNPPEDPAADAATPADAGPAPKH